MDHQLKSDFQGSTEFESVITSNDLLLKNILRQLPFKDLLNCSLINQRWRHYCRAELRRRNCLAWVNRGTIEAPCELLQVLNDLLAFIPAELIPFNGLRIDYQNISKFGEDSHEGNYYWPDKTFSANDCSADWVVPEVLAKCPVKTLRLCLKERNCSSIEFIRLLFQRRRNEIEQLAISNYWEDNCNPGLTNFLGIYTSNWLPNLRILEMDSKMTADVLIQIVNGAPNLREIRGFIGPRHTPFLVGARKVNLVTEFGLDPDPTESLDACLEFARRNPRLKSLYVNSRFRNDPWESQQFLEILALLMEGSAATLDELEITHIDLLLLSSLDIPPMQKLKYISLNYYPMLDIHLGCLSLEWIDYCNLFPALESIHIYSEVPGGSRRFETVPENLQMILNQLSSRVVHSSRSVRSLEFGEMSIIEASSDLLKGLETLFSAVTSITFGECRDLKPYIDFVLGTKWPLEDLSLDCTHQWPRSFNALLCGISSDESIHLAEIGSDSMHKFNFTPIEHSLINLTNLKSLEIVVGLSARSNFRGVNNGLISEVTRALMLSKIPGLKIDVVYLR